MVVLRMYYVQVFNHISVLFCSDRFIVNQKNCDTDVIFLAFLTLFNEGGGVIWHNCQALMYKALNLY